MIRFMFSVVAATFVSTSAHAAYVVNFMQVGTTVVATGDGSIDLTQLTYRRSVNTSSGLFPALGNIGLGNFGADTASFYEGLGAGGPFGTGGFDFPDIDSGNIVVLVNFNKSIYLPSSYISGTDLGTSTAVFDNATFQSLGLTPGSYVTKLGTGMNADTFTINIPGVPEPATWAMMVAGIGAIGATMRIRQRVNVSFA